ncbi:hypothetical protein H0H93_000315, partial [Arthromyces matolae]
MTFMGLSDESRAWRYYNPETRKVSTSRNVIFPRDVTSDIPEQTQVFDPVQLEGENTSISESTQDTDSSSKSPTSKPPLIPREKSTRIAKVQAVPLDYRLINNPAARPSKVATQPVNVTPDVTPDSDDRTEAMIADVPDIALLSAEHGEPSTVNEALASNTWTKSMQAELDQLKNLGTY